MSVEQVICGACGGRGGYTLGPYPATKCNRCNGKGYVIVEAKAAANPDSALRQAPGCPRCKGRGFRVVSTSYRPGDICADLVRCDECNGRGDLRRAREAHALITEALQRGEK